MCGYSPNVTVHRGDVADPVLLERFAHLKFLGGNLLVLILLTKASSLRGISGKAREERRIKYKRSAICGAI